MVESLPSTQTDVRSPVVGSGIAADESTTKPRFGLNFGRFFTVPSFFHKQVLSPEAQFHKAVLRLAKDLILRQFNIDRYVVPHIEDKVNDKNGKVTSSMTFNFTGTYSPSPMGNELPLTQVVDHPIPEQDYLGRLETKLNDTLQGSEAKGLGEFSITRNDHSCTVLFTADPGFTDEQKQSFVENKASILSALLPEFSTSQRQ